MLRKTAVALICAVLGAGASVAIGACGEDRGEVEVEGGTTGTGGHESTGSTAESTGTAESGTTDTESETESETEGTTTGG